MFTVVDVIMIEWSQRERERTLLATQIETKKTSNGTKVYMSGRLPERA